MRKIVSVYDCVNHWPLIIDERGKIRDISLMAKDQLANLSHAERMEMLMREKDSPKGLTMGRRVLELMQLEFLEVLDMQKLSLIHISEPTRLLSISYAVFCLKKKK